MTVRRSKPDGKRPAGPDTENPRGRDRPPLITQRAALILLAALLIGVAAGLLSHLAGSNPASAVLSGGAACAGAIALLDALIGLRTRPAPPLVARAARRASDNRAARHLASASNRMPTGADYDRLSRQPGACVPGQRPM